MGCYATLQTADVQEGFHISAAGGVLTDQARNGREQGADLIFFITPSYGFGSEESPGWVEVGLPIGMYLEEGFESIGEDAFGQFGQDPEQFLILPYVKLGLLPEGSNRLALLGQSAFFVFPSSVTLIYSRDLTHHTPYLALKYIFSGGPAGDDPIITRYQQEDQVIWSLAAGNEFRTALHPTLELGILFNSFIDDGSRQTRVDVFLASRVGL